MSGNCSHLLSQFFKRTSFDLLVTVNGTINPAAFVQKYYIKKNVEELASVLQHLASSSDEINKTLSLLNGTKNDCLLELEENLQTFRVTNIAHFNLAWILF
jgi:hypothetical protein